MDDTLIHNNAWFDFNTLMGVSEKLDQELYTEFITGKISYTQWIDELRAEYAKKKISRREIQGSLYNTVYREGAHETIKELKRRGYITAMITGAFDVTAFKVGQDLGITHVAANTRCLFDRHDIFQDIISYGDEESCKILHLSSLCRLLNIKLTDCAAVGDGSNDIGLFITTNNGVAFDTSNERAKAHAKHIIKDLSDLLSIFK